jgi:hypothetical protein
MKKKAPKLSLHRETLRELALSHGLAVGGIYINTGGRCYSGDYCTASCNNHCNTASDCLC